MMHTAPRVQDVNADRMASSRTGPYLRALLSLGSPDVLSGAAAAIEREFPCLNVEHAAHSPDGRLHSSDGLVPSGNA